ncbi:MAG: hypothetical protein UV41_C0028G0017, partial [Candidatus Daviesbacteria bacterium GW2011_GWA2_42_7]
MKSHAGLFLDAIRESRVRIKEDDDSLAEAFEKLVISRGDILSREHLPSLIFSAEF